MIMITAILYGVLVHVIVCTTADGSERHQFINVSNPTKASLSRENDTYQNNKNKECILIVNETDLIFLQQLVQSKVVHVVELDLQFPSNTSNSMIKEWRWNVTNNVGREILSVLAMDDMFTTWTLDVGRKMTKVRVVDEPPGCATVEKEPGDFIAGAILKQLSFVDEKEMCFDKVSNKSTQTRCCKIIGKDLLHYQCYVSVGRSEFVRILESTLSVFSYSSTFWIYFLLALFSMLLQWRSTNNTLRRQGYYQLTECPMSISSILCMLFWDGYGRKKSCVRRCLLVLVVFLVFLQTHVIAEFNSFFSIYSMVFFLCWCVFYPFTRSLNFEELHDERRLPLSPRILKLVSYLGDDIHDVYLAARTNVLGGISLITLPFNFKRWKKSLARFYYNCIASSTIGSSLKGIIMLFIKTGVFCLCYILLIFIVQVIFVSFLFFALFRLVLIRTDIAGFHCSNWAFSCAIFVWDCIYPIYTAAVFIYVLLCTLYIVIPLVSGLILNIVYFFPYIVYISTFTLYFCMFWSSVKEQYVVLMRLIFDQNLNNNSNVDSNNNNDNNMNNGGSNVSAGAGDINQDNLERVNMIGTDHVGRDSETRENNSVVDIDDYAVSEIMCVVSEELYDKIREHLLPYHGNLFCFVLKVFGIFFFSYLTLTLVRILQARDYSSTVQTLVTFSFSALPYIIKVVAVNKSEEEKEMWKMQLKHRVKPLVDKFTANNPEMSRTELIIRYPRPQLHEENVEEEMQVRERSTSCETISGQIYR